MFENLEQLIKTIRERKNSSPDKSYTNKLLNDKSLSVAKVKEEIGELIEADKVLGAMEQATIKTGKGWKGVAAGAGEMFKQIKTGIGQIGILAMFNAVFKVIKFVMDIKFLNILFWIFNFKQIIVIYNNFVNFILVYNIKCRTWNFCYF